MHFRIVDTSFNHKMSDGKSSETKTEICDSKQKPVMSGSSGGAAVSLKGGANHCCEFEKLALLCSPDQDGKWRHHFLSLD